MYKCIAGVEPRCIFRFPYVELWATQPPDLDGTCPESARLEENKTGSASNMCIQNTRDKKKQRIVQLRVRWQPFLLFVHRGGLDTCCFNKVIIFLVCSSVEQTPYRSPKNSWREKHLEDTVSNCLSCFWSQQHVIFYIIVCLVLKIHLPTSCFCLIFPPFC